MLVDAAPADVGAAVAPSDALAIEPAAIDAAIDAALDDAALAPVPVDAAPVDAGARTKRPRPVKHTITSTPDAAMDRGD